MKVAFAGKGGVGKTTLAALFIKALSKSGHRVLAVDCDPVTNLGRLLGIADADKIIPVAEMKELISERMGTSQDRSFYKLNPKVDDIPDKFAKGQGNMKLIVMGTVKTGGAGCMCPESNFLKALLGRLLLTENEFVVMDMEAGIEHLGRATARFVDHLFIVTEPSLGSIDAAKKIALLSADIKIKNISILLNKARGNEEIDFIKAKIAPLEFRGAIPFDEKISDFERGKGDVDIEKTDVYRVISGIKDRVIKYAEVQ
jgi:CO dehydrogenase maturation factor